MIQNGRLSCPSEGTPDIWLYCTYGSTLLLEMWKMEALKPT